MNDWLLVAIAVLLSYALGSVPTGLWLGLRLKNIDIREHGSKSIGATNTLRILGKKLGALALIGDIAKGVIAVKFASELGATPYAPIACGIAAIIGHCTSLVDWSFSGKFFVSVVYVVVYVPLPVYSTILGNVQCSCVRNIIL